MTETKSTKDYIIQAVSQQHSVQKSITFRIVAQDKYGFVIERKTKNSTKILAFLPKEKTFYIMNEADHTTQELTGASMKRFCSGLTEPLKLEKVCWIQYFDVRKVPLLVHIMADKQQKSLFTDLPLDPITKGDVYKYWTEHPGLLKYVLERYGTFTSRDNIMSYLSALNDIAQDYGENVSKVVFDHVMDNDFLLSSHELNYMYRSIVKQYNLDPILFIAYIHDHAFITIDQRRRYEEYLRIQQELFEQITEPFPDDLENAITAMKARHNKKWELIAEKTFADNCKAVQPYSYENSLFGIRPFAGFDKLKKALQHINPFLSLTDGEYMEIYYTDFPETTHSVIRLSDRSVRISCNAGNELEDFLREWTDKFGLECIL